VSAFALLAMTLATVGIYGLANQGVQQRRHEIGVRMALGATGGDIRSAVLLEGLCSAAIGVVLGVPCALGATRVLQSYLFGIGPADPTVLTCASLMLVVAALAASYLPARQATTVDPVSMLRTD
jgi:putative ABC transport system permease protein